MQKLSLSLIVSLPRLAVGATYIASSAVKGITAVVMAIFQRSSFSNGCFLAARHDIAKGVLLGLAGPLAPIGHLWTRWDVWENGVRSEFTEANLGSLGKVTLYTYAAIFQDLIDPYRESKSNFWKKMEEFGDFLTHYQGIERALAKAREKNHMAPRIPL